MADGSLFGYPMGEIHSYSASYKVETRLHETHWENVHSIDEVAMEIFSICSQLEPLCKRELSKSKGGISEVYKSVYLNHFDPHAVVEVKKMNEQLLLLPHPQPTLEEYFRNTILCSYFPKVFSYVQDPKKPKFRCQKSIMNDYFQHVSTLNQLNTISQQINWDVHNLVNHKYIAHQTALLFHAINCLGHPLYKYKEEVEEIFPDIKEAVTVKSKEETPHLPPDAKDWLDMMTVSMMERMTGFDEQVIGPIDAACHFVQETLK